MTADKHIEGYELPLYLAATQPPLFFGLPRELGILALVITLVIILGLRMWWLGIVSGLALYSLCAALTRRDAYWLPVFQAHLKQPTFLDW
ncbi:MAG: VirB3 family type IV secretion system protein [Phycisphaerae bacterium]|nr:VirB3 family type IV secretion system protein [Phycisphaerae bacterium]